MSMTMEQVVTQLQQELFTLRAQVAAESGLADAVRATNNLATAQVRKDTDERDHAQLDIQRQRDAAVDFISSHTTHTQVSVNIKVPSQPNEYYERVSLIFHTSADNMRPECRGPRISPVTAQTKHIMKNVVLEMVSSCLHQIGKSASMQAKPYSFVNPKSAFVRRSDKSNRTYSQ